MVPFKIPEVQDNIEGWGPASDSVPGQLQYLPFAPFSKSDKVGKACEWNYTRDRDRNRHHWQRNAGFGREGEPSPFVMEQVDDEGFHLVEQKTPAKPKWGPQRGGRGGMRGGMRQQGRDGQSVVQKEEHAFRHQRGGFRGGWQDAPGRDGQSSSKNQHQAQKEPRSRFRSQQGRGGWGGGPSWRDKPARARISSVDVKSDWIHLNGSNGNEDFTMSLPQMEKLKAEDEPRTETLAFVGSLFVAQKDIDRATVKNSIPLKQHKEPKPFYLAVMDDPVVKRLASEGKGSIFTTDIALAVLMSAPRSVASWDILSQRAGGCLYLDVREGSSVFDNHVNETAQESPEDDQKDTTNMNSMTNLTVEAGYINYCYSQQCLDRNQAPMNLKEGEKTLVDAWNNRPNGDGGPTPAGKAFRYRRFELDEDLYLVVRCEIDAALETKDGGKAYITTKALNEFDPAISGVNWRQKLESQRAAVLANELKNNRNKLARWTCQAMLAGADYMKMGYVSRNHAKDNQHHFVLGTILYRPADFATQIDLKTENMWGITTAVVKRLMSLPMKDGEQCKFLLLKDPNTPSVNIYKVPADSFDFEEELEEQGEGAQDDEDDSDFD